MKADCPLLKHDKKEKKKAMMAAWGSDVESASSEDEEEVANICLMAIEDEPEEVFVSSNESFSQNELQNAFDELVLEFQNICQKNKTLKKVAFILKNDITSLKSENIVLKEKLETTLSNNYALNIEKRELKKNLEKLELTLTKFTKGRDMLDKILASQQGVYDKAGLGYKTTNKKSYQNCFVKISTKSTCIHCSRQGHVSYKCPFRASIPKYLTWIPKVKTTNPLGPIHD